MIDVSAVDRLAGGDRLLRVLFDNALAAAGYMYNINMDQWVKLTPEQQARRANVEAQNQHLHERLFGVWP